MKKIFTLITGALLIAGASFSQSQRLVLFEEFTGETCGPCAAQNPGVNAMLNSIPNEVISIKYQNNIPSVPANPSLYGYNIPEITARQTYYANSYSPEGIVDGNVWNDVAGGIDRSIIDNRYAVTSPFDVLVSHSFSAANDSIYTHTVIRASQALTNMTSLICRIAVIERNIYGHTSANGENHFEETMRKMLPDPNGTALQANWNIGDSMVIDQSWAIAMGGNYVQPVYFQLGVVSFVQDDGTKEVLQAGYSRPQIPLDIQASSIGIPAIQCSSSISPTANVFNNGVTAITDLNINYNADGAANNTYHWTGNLPSFTSASIPLPAITVATGYHTYNVAVDTTINVSLIDNDVHNNSSKAAFGIPVAPVAGDVTEGFQATTFPPLNWIRYNPDYGITWSRATVGGFGTSTASAKMDFYDSPAGNEDNLYLYPVDMTTATGATLTFDVAHQPYSATYNDSLFVKVSTDCGVTWNTEYAKGGSSLATVTGYNTNAFTPTATQWRTETVDLSAYAGQSNVQVVFNALSAYGNNAYVDNVNISIPLGISNIQMQTNLSVYPNPSNGSFFVKVNLNKSETLKVTVTNELGQVVREFTTQTISGIYQIDLSNQSKGTYFVRASTATQIYSDKVTIE